MATERVKGRDLMLFVTLASVVKSLAYATNHTLSLSTSEVDVSDKDTGEYSDSEPGQKTWEITSENTYTTESFDALFDAWANNTPVKCVWNTKKETGSTVPEGGWTPGTGGYEGTAIITSLSANAPVNDKTSYSVTLKGKGAITKRSGS